MHNGHIRQIKILGADHKGEDRNYSCDRQRRAKSGLEAVLKVKVYRVVHRFTLMFTDFYQNFDNISDNLCPSVEPGRLLKQSLRGFDEGTLRLEDWGTTLAISQSPNLQSPNL